MTTPLTTDIGEEYLVTENPDGATLTLLLYHDATDGITEPDDLASITTEPDTANSYARQSSLVSTAQLSGGGGGDFGYDTDSGITFDVSTNSEVVDAIGYVVTFDSAVAGDGGTASDHLIAVDAMATERDLSNYDELSWPAGDIEHVVAGGA